jgi:hypothetical protein
LEYGTSIADSKQKTRRFEVLESIALAGLVDNSVRQRVTVVTLSALRVVLLRTSANPLLDGLLRLVIVIWGLAGPALSTIFENAIGKVTGL